MAALRTIGFLAFLALVGYGLWASDGITDGRWLATLGAAWLFLVLALWASLPRTLPLFNRTTIRTALLLTSVFVVLSVQLVRIQIVRGDAVAGRVARSPGGDTIANPRAIADDLRVARGEIVDRTGRTIATSVEEDDVWRRVYPEPESAYVAGYYSPLRYGKDGLEASYDDELTGHDGNNPFLRWENELLDRPQEGLDLALTLDVDLQRTAHELLNGRPGGAVLIEVETGAVLALASNPHYDPNRLFTADDGANPDAAAYWESLLADPNSPLLLKPTDGLYTPGSTFKTVTVGSAIDAGFASPDELYEDTGELNVEGRIIPEFNRPDDSITEWSLRDALAWSLNVVYAQVGLELGPRLMREYGERFGFGAEIPFDLPVAIDQLASSPEFLDGLPALADTGFGQGEILATPLHMAMIAATFANEGRMMRPYLVSEVRTGEGDVRRTTEPEVWREPISPEAAEQVRGMMVHAVETGYASGALLEGYVVGGKTGTAERTEGEPDAWFIGFIGDPGDAPNYAVAVVLERGGSGLAGALTVGRDLMAAAMAAEG